MGITSAIVLFAVCWFMIFLIVLPLRMTTQGEAGEVVPGTHASAPADPRLKRKAFLTTIWAFVVWGILVAIILSGKISIRDFDWSQRMGPAEDSQTEN